MKMFCVLVRTYYKDVDGCFVAAPQAEWTKHSYAAENETEAVLAFRKNNPTLWVARCTEIPGASGDTQDIWAEVGKHRRLSELYGLTYGAGTRTGRFGAAAQAPAKTDKTLGELQGRLQSLMRIGTQPEHSYEEVARIKAEQWRKLQERMLQERMLQERMLQERMLQDIGLNPLPIYKK